MPELPEVETVMRGLAGRLTGRTIVEARLNRSDLRWPVAARLPERLRGARVLSFRRRAKYILMRLSGGDTLMLHLGMSGRIVLSPLRSVPPPHETLMLEIDDGCRVSLVDPRRFGSLDLVPTSEEDGQRQLAALGPEPLDASFTPEVLSAALAGRRTPIKSALLDQSVVAGLGNIYASEVLFRAGISPRRLAKSVAGARAAILVPAIKATLQEAIAAGGSSLRDFVQPSGELGHFQLAWKVYDRAGQPCERCPGPPTCPGIVRLIQSGRSSFYCPRTQR
jgi:formamidopyrimidine-DNA glycosylase